jgi:hypothetical protein
MLRQKNRQPIGHARRGILTPMIAAALLVVMAGMALVLDYLWLSGAEVELQSAADAAAVAARNLADDDLLRENVDLKNRLIRAREAAKNIAAKNSAVGTPVSLESEDGGRIRFGRVVVQESTGLFRFLETHHQTTSVKVTARRMRNTHNPVAMLLSGSFGHPYADVAVQSEATIYNDVVGFRAFEGAPVPILPLAILEKAPEKNSQSWVNQIEQRRGKDCFAFDLASGTVLEQSDGLTEIVLKSGSSAGHENFHLLEIGESYGYDSLFDQIARGWTIEDLEQTEGDLFFNRSSSPVSISCSNQLNSAVVSALENVIGQCRIFLLYGKHHKHGHQGWGTVECMRPVAGRVMSVNYGENRCIEIVVQPCVLTTKTAVLHREVASNGSDDFPANPYIYKLQLTQ